MENKKASPMNSIKVVNEKKNQIIKMITYMD